LAWTETQAAAAGGVTTVMQYARFKDSYMKVFDDYWATALKNITVDLFFHFTLEAETQVPEVPEYARRWGIRLFKLYIGGYPPGNEIGLSLADSAMLYDTMLAARGLTPTGIVAVHCEDVHIIEQMIRRAREQGRQGLSTWTDVRPSFAEEADIRRAAFLARVTGCSLYIPHTTVEALEVLRDANHAGKPQLYLKLAHNIYLHQRLGCGTLARQPTAT
jgi:dihydropyrimidinase